MFPVIYHDTFYVLPSDMLKIRKEKRNICKYIKCEKKEQIISIKQSFFAEKIINNIKKRCLG